jgi:RNA polymerase sigma-70 factor (ECF subfamily)
MLSTLNAEAIQGLNSRMAVQSVKMGLKLAGFIMAPEEKTKKNGDGLDVSLLESLIQRSCAGEAEAMEALYNRFNRPLFNLIYRYTSNREVAEDLLQDVFLKIFTRLHELRNVETFIGWMYRIAVNTCFGYLRETRGQVRRTIALNDVKRGVGEDTGQSSDRFLKKALDDAIQSLPGRMRTIFLLHEVQGFKHEEIAPMLGCSVGTSKSQLFKARMKIRERLEEKKVI